MLFNFYKDIRAKLQPIPDLKAIDWFNNQYEGVIAVAPVIFIEFPKELKFDQASFDHRETTLIIRLHVVSAAVANQDGSIKDDVIQEHEAIAERAIKLVEAARITGVDGEMSRLIFTGYSHYHRHKGWMVTLLDFETDIFV